MVRAQERAQSTAGNSSLEDLTKSEPYEIAKKRDIDGRSRMDRSELVAALR